jgi:hypothetical protein
MIAMATAGRNSPCEHRDQQRGGDERGDGDGHRGDGVGGGVDGAGTHRRDRPEAGADHDDDHHAQGDQQQAGAEVAADPVGHALPGDHGGAQVAVQDADEPVPVADGQGLVEVQPVGHGGAGGRRGLAAAEQHVLGAAGSEVEAAEDDHAGQHQRGEQSAEAVQHQAAHQGAPMVAAQALSM